MVTARFQLPVSGARTSTFDSHPPFEFVNRAVIALGGIPNKVRVGNMGVVGRVFSV
jgi:hypothetical protein